MKLIIYSNFLCLAASLLSNVYSSGGRRGHPAIKNRFAATNNHPSQITRFGKLKNQYFYEFENTSSIPKNYPFHTVLTACYNPKIHTFGNCGPLGEIHADGAELFTKGIDQLAYDGRNIRNEISVDIISKKVDKDGVILDVGSGVGTFASSLLHSGFSNIVCVDTSPEMLHVAKRRINSTKVKFACSNAGVFLPKSDAIVCAFLMHEQPYEAYQKIIETVYTSLKHGGYFFIVDISKCYIPKEIMRSGEPYIDDYIKDFSNFIKSNKVSKKFKLKKKEWIKDHVTLFQLKKK